MRIWIFISGLKGLIIFRGWKRGSKSLISFKVILVYLLCFPLFQVLMMVLPLLLLLVLPKLINSQDPETQKVGLTIYRVNTQETFIVWQGVCKLIARRTF